MSRVARARQRRKDALGRALLGVVALGVFTIGGFFGWQHLGADRLDEIGCLDSGDHDLVSILLDRSDALTPLQKRGAQQRVRALVEDALPGTRVRLHVLDPDDPLLVTTLFDGCRPVDGRHANAFTQNERRLRARWSEEFERPLQAHLRESLRDAPPAVSPLLEAIQSVALQDFAPALAPGRDRRLLVVSDMLQHTPRYSHYRNDPLDYARFEAMPYAREVGAALGDVDVEIAYVGRPAHSARQTIAHGLFWEGHVDANGGRLLSIRRLTEG